jgi:IclR family acetate operon transcriptional repressor
VPLEPDSNDEVPRSIGRVLDLLEIVIAEQECNLTTAASLSDLTPTTALRHLRALDARGYVARDENGTFSPGPTLYRISAGLRSDGPVDRLIATAQPHLDVLAQTTGESTYLALSDGRSASYIAAAEGTHAIRHVGWIGQHVSLDRTAVGAAFAEPGALQVRTGAVEADITANSIALPSVDALDVAISVLGPEHRMRAEAKSVSAQLKRAHMALITDLGIDQAVAS